MKKRWRRFALLMAMIMVLSAAAACSSGSSSTDTSSDDTAETTVETAATAAEEDTETEVWDGEITEINVYVMESTGASEYADKVIDALNAITETTIGVHANITYISVGDYSTQLSLAITGGETVDLAMCTPVDASAFTTLLAAGQLMDMTDYLADEGSDLLELIGDYADAFCVSGSIYGVPIYRNYANSECVVMREDILEELGLLEFAENATTWSEIEEIYAAVAENYDIACVAGAQEILSEQGAVFGSDLFADTMLYDSLGDSMNLVYINDGGTVSLLAESEEFQSMCEMVREWWDNGWVYEDSLVTSEQADTLLAAGVTFSVLESCAVGVEVTKEASTGYDLVFVNVCDDLLTSSFVTKFGMCMPVTAEEPEAAIRWLNALYTSEELMNLIVWGIEGDDYVLNDEGEATYPDGVTSDTVEYHTADYLYGNQFLVYAWEGNGSDYREIAYEALCAAPISDYLGFTADTTELDNVVASLTMVGTEYEASIFCGSYTDADYEAYIDALYDAGIEDYIAAFQEQLDAWLAEN